MQTQTHERYEMADHQAESANALQTRYQKTQIDGMSIFWREAGPVDAPVLLLLHGFPSSSRMYEPLLTRLAARFRLVAPDYPGFGYSDAPAATDFDYTFDNLATTIIRFTEIIGLHHYALYMQDYGGPVGMRMALAHPERIRGLIIQNAVSHDDGLGPLWIKRRQYWEDRAGHEAELRATFLSPETTRQRHVGHNPTPQQVNPDRWNDEIAFLARPGQADIQADLFFDYRSNVASYSLWGKWLRKHQPHSMVLWGRWDPSFEVAEVVAFKKDVPDAEIYVVDGGHFALDDRPDELTALVGRFLEKLAHRS